MITNKQLKYMKVTRKVDNRMHDFGLTTIDPRKRTAEVKVNKKKSKKEGGRGEVLASIYHEETHLKHPNMKEKTVRKIESKSHKLPAKEKKRLYSLYKGGEK